MTSLKSILNTIDLSKHSLSSYLIMLNTEITLMTETTTIHKPNNSPQTNWLSDNYNNISDRSDYFLHLSKIKKDQRLLNHAKKLNRKAHYIANNDKKNHYMNKINEAKNNPKKMWQIISDFTKTPTTPINSDKMEYKNNTYTNPKDISNAFNIFFTNTISEIVDSQPNMQPTIHQQKNENINPNQFNFKPCTHKEVREAAKNLKQSINKNETNSIPTKPWHLLNETFTEHITYFINKSFAEDTFPNNLKLSIIKPKHKNGSKHQVENYRPIANLPYLSKFFEKIAYNQVNNYINKHNLLYDYQFGFRSNMSTETALDTLINFISIYYEKNEIISITFLDFKKAFDSINHDILISKLQQLYNFSTNATKWIQTYITNRTQKTLINSTLSNPENILYGVPQGSILGPLLFILLINDLKDHTIHKNTKIINYADDTILITTASNSTSLISKTNEELSNISNYCKINQLFLNYTKTTVMIINNHTNFDYNQTFKINNNMLNVSTQCKYLGYTIDNKLKFKDQTDLITKKLISSNYALQCTRNFIPRSYLLNLYYALTISHIIYNKSILIKISNNKLKSIQQQLLLSGSIIDNCKQKYVKNHIFNIKFQLQYYYYIKLFNIINRNKHKVLKKDLKHPKHHYTTRYKTQKYKITNFTHNITKLSNSYFAPRCWNKLPTHISNTTNFNIFRKKLHKHIINKINSEHI